MTKLYSVLLIICLSVLCSASSFENAARMGMGTVWTGYKIKHMSGASGVVTPNSPAVSYITRAVAPAWGSYSFSASVDNYTEFAFIPPRDYKLGSSIKVYLDWTPTNASAGDVMWVFAYRITAREAVIGATTTTPVTLATDSVDDKIQQDLIATVVGPDSISKIFSGYIQRDGNAGGDSYAAVTNLIGVTLVYEIDRAGT